MTKVLFVGNVLEKSGWGNHARNVLRSLKSVGGLDVVCRPIVLGQAGKVDEDIEDTIRKDSRDSEVLIQMVLPHHMMYQGGVKNIGFAITETSNFVENTWADYLNLMDEIWIPNSEKLDHVDPPQFTIPPPTEVEKYYDNYRPIDMGNLNHRYKFYTICENNKRKNITGMIIAFYRAFTYEDMTALIIKVNEHGTPPEELKGRLEQQLLEIQKATGLSTNFPPVVFITDYYTKNELYSLHKTCDCYVAPSYGEAINYPLLDACGFCNYAISSDVAGPRYMKECGLPVRLVSGMTVPCYNAEKFFRGYNTLSEDWFLTDLGDLSNAMKEAINKKVDYTNMEHFSHESVGEHMIERVFSV
jgi:glycosyltransferase involved in cell wall biosynthesis